MKEILAFILARGGSKRLPGKNIKELNGKPLIQYTIEAGQQTPEITRIIVSTDDPDIAHVARKAGAEVPFPRPASLSDDHASPVDACLYLLDCLEKDEKYIPETILLLQPTSPLRTAQHIQEAFHLYHTQKANSVLSVSSIRDELSTFVTEGNNGMIQLFVKEQNEHTLPAYKLNGAIYIVKTSAFRKERSFFTKDTLPYVMTKEDSVDIDTSFDFSLASLLLKGRSEG
ncbi:cytidylyltransferase domain-containing protein [Alteribacter aurantiacus]|uniref:acylneuraminate cytidylyltransferase family protein n=1 Tax=Alteribacter aurantiacus TaxID=254410 RepID=UPI0003F691A0|nr:acylneuraminate cytidylyltransferase family protein [Alteribacter aurantiacus]